MSCCSCNRAAPTKPPRRGLKNLEYLELLSKIDQMVAHAKEHHLKEQWKCKWLFHDWRKVTDADYDTHAVCHRCGKYQPTSYANPSMVY